MGLGTIPLLFTPRWVPKQFITVVKISCVVFILPPRSVRQPSMLTWTFESSHSGHSIVSGIALSTGYILRASHSPSA